MSDPTEEILYANALNQIRELGPARFGKLRAHFGSMKHAWQAPLYELLHSGLDARVAETVVSRRKEISPEEEFTRLAQHGVEVILPSSSDYPALLHQINNAPALLYLRGNRAALNIDPSIAVVGTRKVSPYGKQAATRISSELAQAGVCVVSGLATGVDGIAHESMVSVRGTTIAVLGSGIDEGTIYPSLHRVLATRIIEGGGALISELPLFTPPLKMHFPFRNRIIAGMTQAAVIVEADERSGSLITALAALDYNREVFAVPGSIFSATSLGPNRLLMEGARPALSAKQILEDLGLQNLRAEQKAEAILPETHLEEKLLPLLSTEPVHINALIATTGLPPGDVASTLTMMELKGKVRNLGAMQYVRAR